jgi:signal transduction histidine kinase
MLSSTFHLYSFGDYLNYYDATTRIILFGLRNILYSLTLVLFILFMIFEIQVYLEESTRVKELNKSLFELTQRLRLSNVQLKEYSKRNEEMAKLKERNRLAREIHDSIGHYLTAIDMGVKSCLRAVDHDPSRLPDQLSKVNDLTKKSLVDVRRSIKELRPDALTRYSLISAIENLSSEISDLSRVKVRLEICGTEYKLKTHIEEFIYRIVQEGISNAIRHSKPSRIMIIVDYREASINIRITNDGLEAENIDPGFGLTHIKSKVEELSGTFRYSVNPDMEFIFEIDIPQARRTL